MIGGHCETKKLQRHLQIITWWTSTVGSTLNVGYPCSCFNQIEVI